jgi:hypothetical protein
MSDRASKALAEASLPGYDVTVKFEIGFSSFVFFLLHPYSI